MIRILLYYNSTSNSQSKVTMVAREIYTSKFINVGLSKKGINVYNQDKIKDNKKKPWG